MLAQPKERKLRGQLEMEVPLVRPGGQSTLFIMAIVVEFLMSVVSLNSRAQFMPVEILGP